MKRLERGLIPAAVFFLSVAFGLGQENGNLQIHFMNVGQGDGAILISPQGETVLFDNGVRNNCDKPVSYLDGIGVQEIDYHVASHYHSDHIGCSTQVLSQFTLQKAAYDRGGNYSTATYRDYKKQVGRLRKTAKVGDTFTLDAGSANPVTVKFIAVNAKVDGGAPVVKTSNENDLSLVATVQMGNFDVVIGGDLSGFKTGSYEDIEGPLADHVGPFEVYKVHHHGSAYSSNDKWLDKIRAQVGIISTGDGNDYGHPTIECLERLHAHNMQTYWTETGEGAQPDQGWDTIGGNIVVEYQPGADEFTVSYSGGSKTYKIDTAPAAPVFEESYAWSKKSKIYHYANCRYVKNISSTNLQVGNSKPQGKTLHKGCPK